jgi:hypothetical protein
MAGADDVQNSTAVLIGPMVQQEGGFAVDAFSG